MNSLSSNPNADRSKSSYKEKVCNISNIQQQTNSGGPLENQRERALKDGKHPIWKCEKKSRRRTSKKNNIRLNTIRQIFVRRAPGDKLLWQILRRQWLGKSSKQVGTLTIQECGTKTTTRNCRGGLSPVLNEKL